MRGWKEQLKKYIVYKYFFDLTDKIILFNYAKKLKD